jgi:RHS repeat-associated protein
MQTTYNQPNVSLTYTNGGLDRYGRIINHSWIKNNNPLVHIIHSYDYAGNRIKRYDPVHAANSELYTYDNLGQIKTLNRGILNNDHTSVTTINHSESWNFDKTGNWSQYTKNGNTENRTHNAANELQGIATHDANGNMTLMPGLKGKYDAWNRLIEVRDSNNNLIAQYEYNGLNQRTKKTVNNIATKSFFNEKWQEVESITNNQITSYVWGLRYIDDLILREKGEERLYSLADPNWNVIAISDSTGDIQERYVYDAFGKQNIFNANFTAKADTEFNWNRAFTGQVIDSETGWMLYRNRYYSTEFGRFVNRDPIEYESGLNLYRYVNNNTQNYLDPDGLDDIEGSGNCTDLSLPVRFETESWSIPAGPFVKAKVGLKIVGVGRRRSCKKCCSDGAVVEDITYRVQASVFARAEFTVGKDIDYNLLFGRKLKGYIGGRLEVGGEGRVTGSVQTDKCNGIDNPEIVVCGQGRIRGVLRIGISVRFTTPYQGYDVVAGEGWLDGNISWRWCGKITTGGISYHSHEIGKFSGNIGWRACLLGICYGQSYALY